MTLQQRRAEWEKNLRILTVATRWESSDYCSVLVILAPSDWDGVRSITGCFRLHRYFRIGDSWEVSVDYSDCSLSECLTGLQRCFSGIYPEKQS